MPINEVFSHPFCAKELKDAMQRTSVREIAPDSFFIEGVLGYGFFIAPPSSNIFILRDGDMVLMVDSGMHPYYRPKILNILKKLKDKGAKTLVLMVTQGHWDHAMNNDVILEAGYEDVRFLLPEPEAETLQSTQHWIGDMRKLEEYIDSPYEGWIELIKQFEEYARFFDEHKLPQYQPVWESIAGLNKTSSNKEIRTTVRLLSDNLLLENNISLYEQAEILKLDERQTIYFGTVKTKGWQIGRFFVIHDASHSPGHICVYDPKNKLMIAGDVTIEINPAFFDSNFSKCIEVAGKLKQMAEQGFIELATDGHRSSTQFSEATQVLGLKVLDPIQLVDVATGKEECVRFFETFESLYIELQKEVIAAHAKLGKATVPEIVEELFKSDSKAVQLKKVFPFPSRADLLVVKVLVENGYRHKKEGDRTVFSPPEIWQLRA